MKTNAASFFRARGDMLRSFRCSALSSIQRLTHRNRSWRFAALILLFTSACGSPPRASPPPSAMSWLFDQGLAALAHGDNVRAEQYLRLAEQNGVPAKLVLPHLLRACIESTRLRAAITYAEPYLAAHPEELRLRYLVATLRISLGQLREASQEASVLLKQHPDSPDGHYLAGLIASEAGANPRRYFEEYLALAPNGGHAGEVKGRLLALDSASLGRELLDRLTHDGSTEPLSATNIDVKSESAP